MLSAMNISVDWNSKAMAVKADPFVKLADWSWLSLMALKEPFLALFEFES